MTERRLPGGRSFGAVRVGDEVRRPAQPWTATVHSVLAHLEDGGFDGAPWRPGLVIAHLDASRWNAVWAGGGLAGFAGWDTASPSRREDDLAFSALTWVPLLTAEIAGHAGFCDAADRRRRFHLLLDAYGY